MKILEGAQVLGNMEQILEFAKKASPEEEGKQLHFVTLGRMADLVLEKSRRWNLPLPPQLIQAEEEARILEANATEGSGNHSQNNGTDPDVRRDQAIPLSRSIKLYRNNFTLLWRSSQRDVDGKVTLYELTGVGIEDGS
jgi:hypothetical protein